MRKLHLLSTVAASLLLAAGAASAQGVHQQMGHGAAAQQNAPAEKVAPSMHAGQHMGAHTKAQTTGQGLNTHSNHKAELKSEKHNRAENKSGMRGKSETTGQAPNASESGRSRMQNEHKMGSSSDHMKSERRNGAHAKANESRSSMSEKSSSSMHSKSATTGQGAAAGVHLSSHQRTKIVGVIRKEHVRPTHLNISVRVGARVPAHVHYYPLPATVINVYPRWRGYDYILVSDQIIIIDPHNHEIVAILET